MSEEAPDPMRAQVEELVETLLRQGLLQPEQAESARTVLRTRERENGPLPAPPVLRDGPVSTGERPRRASSVGTPEGKPFGRYRLLGPLGGGGMGLVYRAYDSQLNRHVALKVIRSGMADEKGRQRFHREASAMARLRHPNILPVFDVGEQDSQPYYTMELIEGESLKDILQRTKSIPPRAALRIVRDVALGIQQAHEQGIVHRDLKPANVMVTSVGGSGEEGAADGRAVKDSSVQLSSGSTSHFRVLVTDFGLARDVAAETQLTQTGEIMGTPSYMSPEQADGDVHRLGPRTDVYSLGVLLYESIAGAPPFEETNVQRLLAKIIREEPTSLDHRVPALHTDVATICAKAMAKSKDRRYASAQELAEDITRYLKGEEIHARPASWTYRAWRKAVRHRNILVPVLAAILAGSGFLAYPPLKGAWDGRVTRLEREARAAAARKSLAAARSALERRDLALASRLAEGLVQEGNPDEDLPLAEAHALLAAVHRIRAEAADSKDRADLEKKALKERFRGYRAAVGRESARPFLLQMARELVDQARYAEARGILGRLARGGVVDALTGEITYGLGQCAEGEMRFGEAAALFRRASAQSLPEALQNACREHLDLCSLLETEALIEDVEFTFARVADLDRDGYPELVCRRDRELCAGSVSPRGEWKVKATWKLPDSETFSLSALAVHDLDGDGVPEVLAAGGSIAGAGALFVMKMSGGTFDTVQRIPLSSSVNTVEVADLDADGDPEILVGTAMYERSLRIYTWNRKSGEAIHRLTAPMGGDVAGVFVSDANGDGKAEILVTAGPWRAYGVKLLQWNGGDSLTLLRSRPLGIPVSSKEASPRGGTDIAIGIGWWRDMLYPLKRTIGEEAFSRDYSPPGVYLAKVLPTPDLALSPLVQGDWSLGDQGSYRVTPFRGLKDDYLWVSGGMDGFADNSGPAPVAGSGVYVRRGSDWRPLVRFPGGSGVAATMYGAPFGGVDLDGDGEDELPLQVWQGEIGFGDVKPVTRIFGLRDAPKPTASGAAPDEAAEGAASARGIGRLDVGLDAESVGLWDEALKVYADIRVDPSTPPAEAYVATLGALRSLGRLGKFADLSTEAHRAAAEYPGLESEFLPACVDALTGAFEWKRAAEIERLRASSATTDPKARDSARERASTLDGLAAWSYRTELIGPHGLEKEWMLSSPWLIERKGNGMVAYAPCDGSVQFCMVPVSLAGTGQSLRAVVETERLEWACGLACAVGTELPWAYTTSNEYSYAGVAGGVDVHFGALLSAHGSTNSPQRDLEVTYSGTTRIRRAACLSQFDGFPRRLDLDLRLVPFPDRAVVTARADGGAPVTAVVPAGPQEMQHGFAGLCMPAAHSGPGYWGKFIVSSLEFLGARSSNGLRSFTPRTPLEHLFSANGLRVFGQVKEARAQYDLAVQLAAREREMQEANLKAGLSSPWEGTTHGHSAPWAEVDALLYRGLLRWTEGDREGGLADLLESMKESERREKMLSVEGSRFTRLIARFALPLLDRPTECEALRAAWLERAGRPEGPALDAAVEKLDAACGEIDEATEALFGPLGYRLDRHLIVQTAEPNSSGAMAGFQTGDEIVSCGGKEVHTSTAFGDARIAAREGGAAVARIVVRRESDLLELSLPSGSTGLRFDDARKIARRSN